MKKEIILGGILFATLCIVLFRTIVSTQGKLDDHPYRMKLYYSRIDGIKDGTTIYVKGVESGFVYSIDIVESATILDTRNLDPSKSKAVELTLALKEPITLWDNYRIQFNTKSVFSDRVIDIYPGFYPGDETVFYNPTYPENESELSEFFPSARYFDNFFEVSNAVITDNQTDLRSFVVNTKEITEKLRTTEGTLPLLINTSEVYDELDITLAMVGITIREARRYQEGHRKLERTHPIPFMIHTGFIGGRTLSGREIGRTIRFQEIEINPF